MSRITKVEVGVRLTTLTETLTILNITKNEPNNCFIIHLTKKKKKMEVTFLFLH